MGGWYAKAELEIKKLARAQAMTTGKDEEEAMRHLFQRLAVLLVKGNAALLVNRVPNHTPAYCEWRAKSHKIRILVRACVCAIGVFQT